MQKPSKICTVAVLHTLYLRQFSVIISVQTFQHLKVTAQQTFKKTTKQLTAVLHMETTRTARLHERNILKCSNRKLLGAAAVPLNMSLALQDLFYELNISVQNTVSSVTVIMGKPTLSDLSHGVPCELECAFSKILKKQSTSCKGCKHTAFHQYEYDNVPSAPEYH